MKKLTKIEKMIYEELAVSHVLFYRKMSNNNKLLSKVMKNEEVSKHEVNIIEEYSSKYCNEEFAYIRLLQKYYNDEYGEDDILEMCEEYIKLNKDHIEKLANKLEEREYY